MLQMNKITPNMLTIMGQKSFHNFIVIFSSIHIIPLPLDDADSILFRWECLKKQWDPHDRISLLLLYVRLLMLWIMDKDNRCTP